MSLQSGTKLGPCEILGPLGAGGMGEVYKAKDTRLDRFVAIKVLPGHLTANPDALARFEREAKAVAALNHPNILGIFDLGREDGVVYAVMELLEGKSLRSRLTQGPLPVRKAIEFAVQLANGLAAAHDRGVIHRDLKPENLWITKEGRLKILDFGLAKHGVPVAHGSQSFLATEAVSPGHVFRTEEGLVLGTMGYMSPEQVRGEAVDARSDIFSFGVVLFEMVTGKRAFDRDTAADTMVAILKEDPPDLEDSRKPMPPGLRRILDHCLEKVPGQRFHDAEDLAFALSNLGSGDSSASFTTPFAAPNRKTTGIWAGLVGLALLVALGAGWMMRGEPRTDARQGEFKQLNFRPEAIIRACFAPDGKTVVYSAAREGNRLEVFVVRPDAPEPQSLGLKDTHLLGVSSKGELAVLTDAKFIRHRLFRGTLARLPLGGGAPRAILAEVREADWSPDGTQLAVIREVDGQDRLEFPIGNVLCRTSGYFSDLKFSPHGDGIAFFEHPFQWDDRGTVNHVDLLGHARVLAEGYEAEEGLAWGPDGKEIFYSGSLAGMDQTLFAVTLKGRKRIAFQGPGGLTMQDISREGRWLVTRDELKQGLVVLQEERERDLSWLDGTGDGVLSQDAKWIVFTEWSAAMGQNYAIGMRRTDGSPVVRLGMGGRPRLSWDGRWVLAIVPGPPSKLMIYPTGAGQPRQLDQGNLERYSHSQWFRDGFRVLIVASEAGHGSRCYLQTIAGGPPRALTPEGTREVLLSPDERQILARNPQGGYSIYPVEGGDPGPVLGVDPQDSVFHWCADGRSILVFRGSEVPCRVERVELATGRRSLFRVLAPKDLTGLLALSPTFITDDLRAITYETFLHRSRLYATEGAP